jgi:hypothetical protein
LNSLHYERIGELLFDQLNDSPSVEMECWRLLTDGDGKKLRKEINIKPKTFFTKIITAEKGVTFDNQGNPILYKKPKINNEVLKPDYTVQEETTKIGQTNTKIQKK